MKCPLCNTKKPMGSTHARLESGKVVPTWLCSPCGCNIIKDFFNAEEELTAALNEELRKDFEAQFDKIILDRILHFAEKIDAAEPFDRYIKASFDVNKNEV